MPKIILATSSLHRIEAFKTLGIKFTAKSSEIDEKSADRPTNPEQLVRYLAKRKAETVAEKLSKGFVLGFDSIGLYKGRVLEKPKTKEEALERLIDLSGKEHIFLTGIHLISLPKRETRECISETTIQMRNYSENEAKFYLDNSSDFNTFALGYNPLKGYSSTFVRNIEGGLSNIIYGLPLAEIASMIEDVNS